MDPAEDLPAVADITLHQGHMVLAGQVVDVAVNLEIPEAGGHFGGSLPHHMLVVAAAVVLQRLDGDDLHPPFPRLFQQLGGAHHGTVHPA